MLLANRNIFIDNVYKQLRIGLLFLVTLLGSQAEEHLILASVSSPQSHFTPTDNIHNILMMPSCGI